jgi:predicted nicotinamide N-methyase
MAHHVKTDISDYGVMALRARHEQIRGLKRLHSPSFQGFRIWPSSWLVMDYLSRNGLSKGARVMEIGCGWGLAGIYCAKNHAATVTGVDRDKEVFPYMKLHADMNSVEITPMEETFDGLTGGHLKHVDVLIGADICFWDRMINSLKGLIGRALISEVHLILIADPGRYPFEELGAYCVAHQNGEMMNWTVTRPHQIQGRILKIGSFNW